MKTIETMRDPDLLQTRLDELLREDAAKEVVGGRKTLPKTLPAKRQLALDILQKKADRMDQLG